MHIFWQVVYDLLWVFIGLLWVRFVVDVVQMFARAWQPRGVLLVLLEGVYTVTDPPIRAVRRLVPPLRLGGVALDLSFMIVLLVAWLVNEQIVFRLAER